MQDIEFSTLPGDKIAIRMIFDGAPPVPTGYTIEQPARIALDLIAVTSGLDSKYHTLGSGNARSVAVVEAGDRTRVIVSMTELVAYSTRVEGNELMVLVGAQDGATMAAITESGGMSENLSGASTNYVSRAQALIEDIDFRRGENGEGRVIVKLNDPGIGVDVYSEGGNIRVEFTGAHIPESLQRRLDVTDFATPVLSIDALPEADNTVLMIEPTGEYEYLAYQADELFTLEVKPLSSSEFESNLDAVFRYRGEKLSLNFQDIQIRSVLQLIADFTDLNLVASDTVNGRITLRLKNVPWDQALDIIMKTKGLDKREVGNVLMVAPAEELAAREKLELESRQQISELAPLRTEFIEVRYASAGEIFALFESSGEGEGVLSGRGSVIVDERTNSIILTETTDKINEFRAVLEKLDVPVRQVLIEARIVTAASNFSEALGVRWGGLGYKINGDNTATAGGSLTSSQEVRDGLPIVGNEFPDFTSPDHLVVDLGVSSPDATSFAIGLVNDKYLLDLEISALESQGSAEVIARPKVITADKQEATISSGVEIPYQEASSSGATSVSFKSATLQLAVKPQITPDDRIIMELEVKQDTVGAVFNGVPSINTNNVKTQVLVDNGETIVLGGIFTVNTSESVTKTPFLGDLPYVGSLFRRNTRSDQKQELLIFITPRLIRDSLTSR
ncbi:MAG: type IV pilus secretin PilQ family protein [Pseudomonadales bacterium]|nr:type IV pilus secretin PilQ family protein [Pseudomonadales bacterium]MDG1444159.1 type IV pilus secretin PilQ family protein [Pseudomonadales bacterium]